MASPVIDTHTHLLDAGHWPSAWWDHVAEGWAAAMPGRSPDDIRDAIEPGLLDPDGSRMVERMDGAQVDASVILPIDWGPDHQSWEGVQAANDHAAAVSAAYPGRFVAFAGIDPRRRGAAAYVEEKAAAGAIQGVKLYPACGWDPSSPEAVRVYEAAAAAGLPVLFHTGDPLPILDRALCDPSLLLPVVRDLPTLKVWLGHAGAPDWWEEACRVADASESVRLEMSVWIWDDSDADAVARWEQLMGEAASRFGASRIVFGSDHVSGRKVRSDRFLRTVVDAYRGLVGRTAGGHAFTQGDIDLILGGNALSDLPRPLG